MSRCLKHTTYQPACQYCRAQKYEEDSTRRDDDSTSLVTTMVEAEAVAEIVDAMDTSTSQPDPTPDSTFNGFGGGESGGGGAGGDY